MNYGIIEENFEFLKKIADRAKCVGSICEQQDVHPYSKTTSQSNIRLSTALEYVVGSKSFRPDIQKPRQMENAVMDT